MIESKCDILIVGGGVGGTAAALAASQHGLRVVVTEQHKWVGGQLTSQGVPPDEHPWIEQCGCTASYRVFRDRVRAAYERDFPLHEGLRGTPFNPGGGFVSGLCHEPRIAHRVLLDMLGEPVSDGQLTIKTGMVPVAADVDGDRILSVHFLQNGNGETEIISSAVVIDCTELGDLLPLTGTEYVSGAESKAQTNEKHAADAADPNDVQGLTWCIAVAFDPKGSHIIERPSKYDFWRGFKPDLRDSPWPGRLLDWTAVSPITRGPRTFDLFAQPDRPYNSLWNYRKIVDPAVLGVSENEATLVNWPQNDYFIQNIIDQPGDVVAAALEDSKQLSLSLLYWMQTEAPRPEGGEGYPGLYPMPGVLGTDDGLAMAPYIRESRRIKALFTVTEEHIGTEMRTEAGLDRAVQFSDSVGIGSYRIDLHPTPTGQNYLDISSLPFQIPLGSLIPQRMRNLIAGNKNIGATHITNGCYRLHPVEWNIGEAAGHAAAYSLINGCDPSDLVRKPRLLSEFQSNLLKAGFELAWPDQIAVTSR